MAHLKLAQVDAYVVEYLPWTVTDTVLDDRVTYQSLLQRFLTYHRWRWALPSKRGWWIATLEQVSGLLWWRHNAPTKHECFELLARKNQAYGIEPLLLTGLRGIAIRCLSKSSRLINLDKGAEPTGEVITDTLVDIFCYCILALMMIDGRLK